MKPYKHLTQEQRYHIYQCLKQGMTRSFIADNIGVNKCTVSREIRRNTGKKAYRYKQAHRLACNRQSIPKYQKWCIIPIIKFNHTVHTHKHFSPYLS